MTIEELKKALAEEEKELTKLSDMVEYTKLLLKQEKYCVTCAVFTFFLFVLDVCLPY